MGYYYGSARLSDLPSPPATAHQPTDATTATSTKNPTTSSGGDYKYVSPEFWWAEIGQNTQETAAVLDPKEVTFEGFCRKREKLCALQWKFLNMFWHQNVAHQPRTGRNVRSGGVTGASVSVYVPNEERGIEEGSGSCTTKNPANMLQIYEIHSLIVHLTEAEFWKVGQLFISK